MLARDPHGNADDPRISDYLALLGARGPSKSEEQAIRAVARGVASAGQQKIAFRYALEELGGAARISFEPESERVSAFRSGSQAAAQILAITAGAAWVSFRNDSAEIDMSEPEAERGR